MRLLALGETVAIPEDRRMETMLWIWQEGQPEPDQTTVGRFCVLTPRTALPAPAGRGR